MIERLLYVAMTDIATETGAMGRIRAILRQLQNTGVETTLVGMGRPNYVNQECGKVITVENVGIAGMVGVAANALREVRTEPIDCVMLSSFGNPINPVLAQAFRHLVPSIAYDCHDPPIETLPLLFGRGLRARALGSTVKLMDPLLRAAVDVAFSVSPGVDDCLRKHGWKMPIFRYYNSHSGASSSIDAPPRLRNRSGWENSQILIYVGGLQEHIRGIEEQIHAVAIARQKGANVKFAAFGWGSPAPFASLAGSLGISEHVLFEPPVSQESVRALLQEATVAAVSTLPFALPSKLFDYLAAGVRVLCSNDTVDVARTCGSLVIPYPNGVMGLADALCDEELKRNDRDLVSTFMRRIESENAASIASLAAR